MRDRVGVGRKEVGQPGVRAGGQGGVHEQVQEGQGVPPGEEVAVAGRAHEDAGAGVAMIADRVFSNNEGTWMEINKQTLDQLNVTLEPPLYVCLMLGENVLFNKIYGK